MIDEVPEGWVRTTLGGICSKPQYGWTTSADRSGGGLKLLRTTDISSGVVDWNGVPACSEEPEDVAKYRLVPGDIVVSRAGSVGVSHVLRDCPLAVFASYLIRFRPVLGIPSEFVGLFLRSPSYWADVAEESAGIAVPNINASKLASLELPLPPLAEQRRIVARVETLLADVSSSREHFAKVPAILRRFRQAVLAAACSGRLTEDWRLLHPDEVQPSLPNRLASPRRTRRGANLSGDELLVDDDLPELPPSWIYARADSVVAPNTVITYGIVLPGPEVPNGIPYVRQLDISDEGIRVGELRHTSTEIASKHDRSQLQPDDVLLCIIRNLRVAIVPPEIAGANITQGAVRLRPSEAVMPRFLAMWLKAPPAQGWMKRRYFGMDMPRINVEDARAVPIGLPPVPEQQEIVRRVDAFFALADTIEKQVAAATARADRLTPSILTKTFRGELVPTEAELARQEGRDYEPASVLLERIRSAREDSNVQRKLGSAGRSSAQAIESERHDHRRPPSRENRRRHRHRPV